MDPEEYQRASREVWATAARLVEHLGLLLFCVLALPVALWLLRQYSDWLVRNFGLGLVLLPIGPEWVSALVVWLARRERIRRGVALAGAVGTLAVGATAAVFQLDSGWWLRTRRFWCRTPAELERLLRARVETSSAAAARKPPKSKSGRRRGPQ